MKTNKIFILLLFIIITFAYGCKDECKKCDECPSTDGLIKEEECPKGEDCTGLINPEDCPVTEEKSEYVYLLGENGLTVKGISKLVGEEIIIPDEDYYEGSLYKVVNVNIDNMNDYLGKKLYLGKNITSVSVSKESQLTGPRGMNNAFKYIEVSEENEIYASKDGVLYSKDFSELIIYPRYKDSKVFDLDERTVKIGQSAFKDNDYIEVINISSDGIVIEKNAFKNCSSLKEFKADNIIQIGSNAFENCLSLLEFKASVITKIESYAFKNCSNLKEFEVTDRLVNTIGEYVFENCYNLINCVISSEKYGAGPDLVTSTKIGQGVFKNCFSLKTVSIPYEIVNKDMFYNCYNLENVSLGKQIFEGAFTNCLSLTKLRIFESMIIEAGAFVSCKNLVFYTNTSKFSENWNENFHDGNEIVYNSASMPK